MLNERVEKLTGYKADKKVVIKYIVGCSRPEPADKIVELKKQIALKESVESEEPVELTEPVESEEPVELTETVESEEPVELTEAVEFEEPVAAKEPVSSASISYEGQNISSFTFKGSTINLESWEQLLANLCTTLSIEHSVDLEKLLWHSVEGKFFFRENADELRLGLNILGTNLFVETALNPDVTVKVAHSVLDVFGFSSDDLELATE